MMTNHNALTRVGVILAVACLATSTPGSRR